MCKDGEPDTTLQKNIDYACGSGADCSAILQNGACYQPNTVKAHCDFAVNSYYQKKSNVSGSCDFAGTATTTYTLTSSTSSWINTIFMNGTQEPRVYGCLRFLLSLVC